VPTLDEFHALALKIGTITRAELNPGARRPAYSLWIDFGKHGEKQSSAQITDIYDVGQLIGRQVVAVTGFDPIRIGGFRSDVLVLGGLTDQGVVLLGLDRDVPPGTSVA
jgi:tRNA-binding protein